jgi:Basic region leucine zipper
MDDDNDQQLNPRQFRTSPASRERNRVHAQRTRQRKKEQMITLQNRAAELKVEQIGLRQTINEKNTATILVGLFATGASNHNKNHQTTRTKDVNEENPMIEALLKRSISEIPDASQIPELPALILPGQHASKKMKAQGLQQKMIENSAADSRHGIEAVLDNPSFSLSSNNSNNHHGTDTENGDDNNNNNIDYELLGRDRSQCSPAELDLIRRERNRMHAKRTRDRKRVFTEQLAVMCRRLEDENLLLHAHLEKIDPEYKYVASRERTPLPDSVASSSPSARKKRAHGNAVAKELKSQQQPPLPKKAKTTRRRNKDDADDSNINNVHVSFSDARLSTLLKAAATYASREQQTHEDSSDSADLHEISDSCSASDEPDHPTLVI